MFVTEMYVTLKCSCIGTHCGVWSVHYDSLFRRWLLGVKVMFVRQATTWKLSSCSDAVKLNSNKFTLSYTSLYVVIIS